MMRVALGQFLAVAAGLLMSGTAFSDHTAVALKPDGKFGSWARSASPKEAESMALAECKKVVGRTKSCKIRYTAAVSRAENGGGRLGYATSFISKKDAEKEALSYCNAPGCKIVWTVTDPGLFAIFKKTDESDETTDFWLHYGATNGDDVVTGGKSACEKRFGPPCKLDSLGAIKGEVGTSRAPAPKTEPQSCRPNTPTIRCSSQCTNGNCVVTYENGCKTNVRVNPKFDPFTNQWTFPAPSC